MEVIHRGIQGIAMMNRLLLPIDPCRSGNLARIRWGAGSIARVPLVLPFSPCSWEAFGLASGPLTNQAIAPKRLNPDAGGNWAQGEDGFKGLTFGPFAQLWAERWVHETSSSASPVQRVQSRLGKPAPTSANV